MNEQMDCLRYREHLDEWIDGMLSDEMAAAMQAHADICPDCAEEARAAREMLDLIHTLDDDIPVPLQAQAAWRSAVRAEAAQIRRAPTAKRFSGVIRAIGSAAAALVVLAGCTGIFRMNGMLTPVAPASEAVVTESAADAAPAYFMPLRRSVPGTDGGESGAYLTYIASDGAVEADTEAAASKQRSMADPEVIPVQTQPSLLLRSAERTIVTENFDSAGQSIRDLTEQYGGYLSDDAVSTAENGLRTGIFTAVIPAVEADSFLQTIDHVGNVTYTAEHLQDVSASVMDIQTRLEALEAEQQRLSELISAATDAEELSRLSLQMEVTLNKLDEVQSESNSLNSQLDSVRVSIRLEEVSAAASAAPTAAPELTERMGAAFSQSALQLQSFVRDMAVSLMIIAPFLITVLVIVIVVMAIVMLIRRRDR